MGKVSPRTLAKAQRVTLKSNSNLKYSVKWSQALEAKLFDICIFVAYVCLRDFSV